MAKATLDAVRKKSQKKQRRKSKGKEPVKEESIGEQMQNLKLINDGSGPTPKSKKNFLRIPSAKNNAQADQLQFTCKCSKLVGVNYACLPIFKILLSIYGGPSGEINYESLCKQYWDIERTGAQCQELKAFDTDIEKDLLRTFPQVPQF